MEAQNSNLHVVYDGTRWAIAAEGEGRLEVDLDLTQAIAVATALAVERRVLLYVHDKEGAISERVDFGNPTIADENENLADRAAEGSGDKKEQASLPGASVEKERAR
ncbi:DUF2188 domain-containing protein [Cupriavidus necator]|uniref:DUF2188 domain-containing protein n=1 Tax=Cupriavidus necator TaxID=106590 RepID=UPI0039C32B3B